MAVHGIVLGVVAGAVVGTAVLRGGPPLDVPTVAVSDPLLPQAMPAALASTTPPAQFGDPITFLRAPIALDAVKDQAVIARALPAASSAPSPAPAMTRAAPSTSTAANAAAQTTPAQAAGRTSPPATFESPLPPDQQPADRAAFAAASPSPSPRPSPGATPAPTPAPAPTPPPQPVLLHEHVVAPGETLSAIGQRYGVSVASLLANNLLIRDGDMLKIGQKLAVPGKDGVLYFVNYGDTLTEIAAEHGVDASAIIGYGPNQLADANSIREGELILVPGGKRPTPPPPPTPVPTPVPTPAPPPPPAAASTPGSVVAPGTPARPGATAAPTPSRPTPTTAPTPPRPAVAGFIWPITGPLSSRFGPSHPLGIDIDLYGRAGAPIVAARGGTVAFAGGNPCCSYGYYVDIDHGDGYKTRYAHFQAPPPVRIGQRVEQGQVVGYAGTTGYSTGVHLHFEIMRSGAVVNPLGLLP